MILLLATSNPGKIAELTELLTRRDITFQTLIEHPGTAEPVENASTFEENALTKARWYCNATGLPTLADDGGLEIDALEGWPGVHSRRIFGDGRRAEDDEMIAEVLRRMVHVSSERRGCQMRSAVAFVAPDGTVSQGSGSDRGVIAETAANHRIPGFPFRSLFLHPDRGCTTAEAVARGARMSDVMTHRREAIRVILPALFQWNADAMG